MLRFENLPYRPASAVLILLSLAVPLAFFKLGSPDWMSFLVGLPVYLLLVWLTYRRFKDVGRSTAWVFLMLVNISFGPRLEGPGPLVFDLGNLLHLVPVALGWLPGRPARKRGCV